MAVTHLPNLRRAAPKRTRANEGILCWRQADNLLTTPTEVLRSMDKTRMDRRHFLYQAGAGAVSASLLAGCDPPAPPPPLRDVPAVQERELVGPRPEYRGPNVILIRFGGGVRRRETIEFPEQTYCPFVVHQLIGKQGILFNNVEIESAAGIETSHGQGTLYLLTGKYDHYEDITHKPLAARFEPKVPTLFEYFRKTYDVPDHQALLINGEDRIDEEFYTFSNHHQYGVHYRSTVLSLYRFKTYLLRKELKETTLSESDRLAKSKKLQEMESKDYRIVDGSVESEELNRFWGNWRDYYGKSGLVNPRGDRLLTELAIRALRELQPRLLMINYQDPDYVHWGNPNFYTQAITIIDDGIRQIYETVQNDSELNRQHHYRDNTVFLIIPDCGRDNARCASVPFQHHFNSKCAHQVFAVAAGPRHLIRRDRTPVDRLSQQISLAATVGHLMGFTTRHVDPAAGTFQEMLA